MSKVVKKKLFFFKTHPTTSEKTPQPQSEISDKKKAKIGKSFFHYARSKKSFFLFLLSIDRRHIVVTRLLTIFIF
jgi:hypothetical protein